MALHVLQRKTTSSESPNEDLQQKKWQTLMIVYWRPENFGQHKP